MDKEIFTILHSEFLFIWTCRLVGGFQIFAPRLNKKRQVSCVMAQLRGHQYINILSHLVKMAHKGSVYRYGPISLDDGPVSLEYESSDMGPYL